MKRRMISIMLFVVMCMQLLATSASAISDNTETIAGLSNLTFYPEATDSIYYTENDSQTTAGAKVIFSSKTEKVTKYKPDSVILGADMEYRSQPRGWPDAKTYTDSDAGVFKTGETGTVQAGSGGRFECTAKLTVTDQTWEDSYVTYNWNAESGRCMNFISPKVSSESILLTGKLVSSAIVPKDSLITLDGTYQYVTTGVESNNRSLTFAHTSKSKAYIESEYEKLAKNQYMTYTDNGAITYVNKKQDSTTAHLVGLGIYMGIGYEGGRENSDGDWIEPVSRTNTVTISGGKSYSDSLSWFFDTTGYNVRDGEVSLTASITKSTGSEVEYRSVGSPDSTVCLACGKKVSEHSGDMNSIQLSHSYTYPTYVVKSGTEVTLVDSAISGQIVVEPNATLHIYGSTINGGSNGVGVDYEKTLYSAEMAAAGGEKNTITNMGTVVMHSGTLNGSYSNNIIIPSGSTKTEDTGSKLVVTSNDSYVEPTDTVPPNISYYADTLDPAEEVTLTISCSDPNGNNSSTPLSIDGGDWVSSPQKITVDSNRDILVQARDSKGNVRERTISIRNIDTEAPMITSLTASTSEWTNKTVKLTVTASDDLRLTELPYIWKFLPQGSTVWQTFDPSVSRTFTVEQNGTVQVYAVDVLGKQSAAETYEVANIDKTAPTITEVKQTPEANANVTDGVTLKVSARDVVDAAGEASGLPENFVWWGDHWGTDTETFYSNEVVNVKVRDSVGNESAAKAVTISSIDETGPIITSFTGTHEQGTWVKAPVTLKVTSKDGDGSALPEKCVSWDGGKSWTSLSTKNIVENGEYTVQVRDKGGNIAEESIVVNNIDSEKPTANIYLARVRSDPLNPDSDFIWKVYVDVADQISGVDYVKTLWDGGTHTTSFPVIQDVTTTGMYGVIVVDNAGNETYTYLTITNEMLGNEAPGSGTTGEYVDTTLNPNIDGLGTEWSDPSNLVYGPDGMYNKSTGNYKSYSDVSVLNGNKGVFLQVNLTSKSETWTTGVAKLNGVDYPLTFDKFGGSMEISAEPTTGYVFIPISNIHQDVKNGRLKILISEWSDESKTENIRSGSLQIYVSVQKTQPIISYNYNRTTGKLTLNPVSTVAGIKEVLYSLDGSTPSVEYSAPFTVPTGSTIKIKATDKVNQITDLTLDSDSLSLNGSSGGMNSEAISGTYSLTSYSISTRTMDSYLINGSQSNTDQVPSSAVLDLFN